MFKEGKRKLHICLLTIALFTIIVIGAIIRGLSNVDAIALQVGVGLSTLAGTYYAGNAATHFANRTKGYKSEE